MSDADALLEGDRKYYDPLTFCTEAFSSARPLIYASVNYRLGALGFLHCPEAGDLLPPNNGYVLFAYTSTKTQPLEANSVTTCRKWQPSTASAPASCIRAPSTLTQEFN